MVEVICVNDKDRPAEIPASHWIKKGETYHITWVSRMALSGFILGCTLKEVDLYSLDIIYETFRLDRFAMTEENFMKLLQLMEDIAELKDANVNLEEILKENTELVPLE